MERINLTKFGFIRSKENDFNDDGNNFTCYKVGKMRVSKLVNKGEAYISARLDSNKLTFEMYSKLPHYNDIDKLNGVATNSLTEEDLQNLYNDCVEYEKEYEAAAKAIIYPTEEEITKQRKRIDAIRDAELADIESKINAAILNLSEYDLKTLQTYYRSLKIRPETYSMLNTAYSIDYVKDTNKDLKPCYWYRSCLELLAKVSIV